MRSESNEQRVVEKFRKKKYIYQAQSVRGSFALGRNLDTILIVMKSQ